jgi:hypothetical protein
MIECRRPCGQCDYVHVFLGRDDDVDTCPKCGGVLYPISTIVTEVAAAADRIEHALVDGQEANTCWSRIDDAGPAERPVVRDVAERLAEAAFTKPIVALLDRGREYARVAAASVPLKKDLEEATAALHFAAIVLEAPCRGCGARGVVLDINGRCSSCATKIESEVDLSERCRKALAAFDARDPRSFAKATKEIVADHPGMTMVEFFDRATGEWDPSRSQKAGPQ